MSVAQIFESFCNRLVLSSDLRGSISTRTGRITRRLNGDFRDVESSSDNRFYAGSYGRGTAVPGCSDIDLIFILPSKTYHKFNAYVGNKQSSLLQAVRASLTKSFPNSVVIADGQIVAIEFTDEIKFEIVPVFSNTSGSYTFANANGGGSWKTCNPKLEIETFSTRNANCNSNLVNLGRMVRAWRDEHSVNMSGMLIDTLAYQFMANWQYRDKSYLYYDYLTRDFFEYLGQQDRNKTYWLAPGSNSHVVRGGPFEQKASFAATVALEAIDNWNKELYWTAKQKYQQIYGGYFPS